MGNCTKANCKLEIIKDRLLSITLHLDVRKVSTQWTANTELIDNSKVPDFSLLYVCVEVSVVNRHPSPICSACLRTAGKGPIQLLPGALVVNHGIGMCFTNDEF